MAKLLQKIQFELDEAGHYTSSQAFGPEGQFRLQKALYISTMPPAESSRRSNWARMILSNAESFTLFDPVGKATGLSIYDAKGKLISHTGAPATATSPSPVNKKAKPPRQPLTGPKGSLLATAGKES